MRYKGAKNCSAIDYMIHTLDKATAIIQNSNNFSSRVRVRARVAILPTSTKHLRNSVRRLYRLIAHTYFHHPEIFEELENEMHLCARFTQFAREIQNDAERSSLDQKLKTE